MAMRAALIFNSGEFDPDCESTNGPDQLQVGPTTNLGDDARSSLLSTLILTQTHILSEAFRPAVPAAIKNQIPHPPERERERSKHRLIDR